MYKRITMLILSLCGLLGALPLLGACHTTAGAGQDISQAGQAIEKSADQHAP